MAKISLEGTTVIMESQASWYLLFWERRYGTFHYLNKDALQDIKRPWGTDLVTKEKGKSGLFLQHYLNLSDSLEWSFHLIPAGRKKQTRSSKGNSSAKVWANM